MKEKIRTALARIEDEFDVRVLYACEAGSRAWGFPSTDSDYDIRFLYLHSPDWYLRVLKGRDVIELPIDRMLDVNGWDYLKALRLFRKCNPNLFEWLNSPIVYYPSITGYDLKELMPEFFNPNAMRWHYLHMARGNFKDYLKGDTVWLKKYLYVVRPLLCEMYVAMGMGIPPVKFIELINQTSMLMPEGVKDDIMELVREKKAGAELGTGLRKPRLSNWMEKKLFDERTDIKFKHGDVRKLDQLFMDELRYQYGLSFTTTSL